MTQPFTLSACAEMLWPDKPIEWRVSRLTELGLGVGLWNWPIHDLDALERTGANFTIMNGYLRRGVSPMTRARRSFSPPQGRPQKSASASALHGSICMEPG